MQPLVITDWTEQTWAVISLYNRDKQKWSRGDQILHRTWVCWFYCKFTKSSSGICYLLNRWGISGHLKPHCVMEYNWPRPQTIPWFVKVGSPQFLLISGGGVKPSYSSVSILHYPGTKLSPLYTEQPVRSVLSFTREGRIAQPPAISGEF